MSEEITVDKIAARLESFSRWNDDSAWWSYYKQDVRWLLAEIARLNAYIACLENDARALRDTYHAEIAKKDAEIARLNGQLDALRASSLARGWPDDSEIARLNERIRNKERIGAELQDAEIDEDCR